MDTGQIDLFQAVARAGNFAAAARERDLSPSSVSRAVQALEQDLGVRLFERTTRAVSLTEAGQHFLDHASSALEELEVARQKAQQATGTAEGHLRIAASTTFGSSVLSHKMRAFREAFPGITVELLLSDSVVDIVSSGIDIAIRHGALSDSSLIASPLKRVRYLAVASPLYLDERNPIQHPDQLEEEETLNFNFPTFRKGWRFEKNGETVDFTPKPQLLSTNAETLRRCACDGLGVAVLADWLVEDDLRAWRLSPVLADWTVHAVGAEPTSTLWLVRPSRSYLPAKVRAFEEFIRNALR